MKWTSKVCHLDSDPSASSAAAAESLHLCFADIDADAARTEEAEVMLRDANHWLNGTYNETKHPKTGATALHVAAAKGYMKVMR